MPGNWYVCMDDHCTYLCESIDIPLILQYEIKDERWISNMFNSP